MSLKSRKKPSGNFLRQSGIAVAVAFFFLCQKKYKRDKDFLHVTSYADNLARYKLFALIVMLGFAKFRGRGLCSL